MAADAGYGDDRHAGADGSWFASELAIEPAPFFTPILGGCAGPEPGGRDDGERQAAEAAAVVAAGEVGGVPGGLLAAALPSRRGPQVERRREHRDPDPAAGQGRGAGRVRRVEAGQDAVARAGGSWRPRWRRTT